MKVLKRNQLIILVVSLMLITAGYLNFTANQENIQTSTIASRNDTTIGDAQLVSTIPNENEENIVENILNEETNANQSNNLEIQEQLSVSSTIDEKNNQEDYYFTTSRLERNTMYSELLETYQEIYNNTNATAEQKSEALAKISNINNTKNAIMIAENLIIAKEFEDVVIFVNEGSVSVIIKTEELKEEHVAQIQNIVSRELNVGAEIIHISNK
ncbi:MAG: SpoIIIAH-like family protein [Clostridia bacterium]|nr:SpoIIIAH-like family protein [Clostridia bacterium]